MPTTPASSDASTPSILDTESSGGGSPASSPSWQTWWDVLMPALSVIVLSRQEGETLPKSVETKAQRAMDMLAVLDETIGGSTRFIRKATSRLPDTAVTGEHRVAFDRLKLALTSLGVRREVWTDAPLRANMLAREVFHLGILRDEVERVAGGRLLSDADVGRAWSFFLSKLEVAELERDWRETARQLF